MEATRCCTDRTGMRVAAESVSDGFPSFAIFLCEEVNRDMGCCVKGRWVACVFNALLVPRELDGARCETICDCVGSCVGILRGSQQEEESDEG